MSKHKEIKVLKHGEVQKKILESPPKVRPEEELVGPCGKYRDENFAIYNLKKKQFFEACKKYNRLNQETLICNKRRLYQDYRDMLDLEFLKDETEEVKSKPGPMGSLQRKRTERPIHQVNVHLTYQIIKTIWPQGQTI